MRIASSSDWRQNIPFETPLLVADIAPGEPGRCASCPADAPARERTELWAVKHRHPNNHDGFVRFYCVEHRPEPPRASAPAAPAARPKRTAARQAAPARTSATKPVVPERVRAVCPTCFLEANANGVCGMCGEQIA